MLGEIGEGGKKGNPERRGCVEDQDMDTETKIALCGHAAPFHFMSQYPIYTHTPLYTHFSLMPLTHHITFTQRRIKILSFFFFSPQPCFSPPLFFSSSIYTDLPTARGRYTLDESPVQLHCSHFQKTIAAKC